MHDAEFSKISVDVKIQVDLKNEVQYIQRED